MTCGDLCDLWQPQEQGGTSGAGWGHGGTRVCGQSGIRLSESEENGKGQSEPLSQMPFPQSNISQPDVITSPAPVQGPGRTV